MEERGKVSSKKGVCQSGQNKLEGVLLKALGRHARNRGKGRKKKKKKKITLVGTTWPCVDGGKSSGPPVGSRKSQ